MLKSYFIIMLISATSLWACADAGFKGGADSHDDKDDVPQAPPAADALPGGSFDVETGSQSISCSAPVNIPGTANIFFAGVGAGASLEYDFSKGDNTDTAANAAPVQIIPSEARCLTANSRLFFEISGTISHGGGSADTSGDGQIDRVVNHVLGARLGKSDIRAPINSMIGVFVDAGDTSSMSAPATLDFSSPAQRDYPELRPALRQVFYVGDGYYGANQRQSVIVPQGAGRLYLGIMDVGQWNNNSGALTGSIRWQAN